MNKSKPCISFLFLGGAKRVAMARMLRKACEDRGYDCRIFGYELDTRCPLACEGTIISGLRWADPELIPHLNEVCRENSIDIVLPFVDGAVAVAAELEAYSPVPNRTTAELMFDKCLAAELFEKAGIPIPKTFRGGFCNTPLIAKPRHGSASKGILIFNNSVELDDAELKMDQYLVQECIVKRQEITIDCYTSVHDGHTYCVSPRIRHEVSGGEAVRTETIANPDAVELARKVIAAANLRGAVTVQLIHDINKNRLLLMEVNPRLGGGAVASVHAKADLPGLIIDDFLHHELAVQQPMAGVLTTRYLSDVVFFPENNEQ